MRVQLFPDTSCVGALSCGAHVNLPACGLPEIAAQGIQSLSAQTGQQCHAVACREDTVRSMIEEDLKVILEEEKGHHSSMHSLEQ